MVELSIVNVVGGGSINQELDLQQVYLDFPSENVEYNPESFAAVLIRYHSPKATIMLYSSGKYSLAGAPTLEQAHEANSQFVEDMEQMLERVIHEKDFEIRYFVAKGTLGSTLDLNKVIGLLGVNDIEYEPEQFPGLFYRPPNSDWFYVIFGSGNIVINKCETEKELQVAFTQLKNKLAPMI